MPPPAATQPVRRPAPPTQRIVTPLRPTAPWPTGSPVLPPTQPHYATIPRQNRTNQTLIAVLVAVGLTLIGLGSVGTTLFAHSQVSASDYDTATYDTGGDATTDPTAGDQGNSTTSEAETGPQPVTALADHPLFRSPTNGAVDTPCSLPEFATDVDSQDAFYRAAIPCLMRAWTPALEGANLPVEPPNVITTDQNINSPCGTRSWDNTAMYCSGNHTIYMTARYYAEVEGQTEAGVYLGQFAHEFGHALQGMVGIMNAYGNALYDAGGTNTAEALELSRRTELQATCFEGESLAALQRGGLSNEYIFAALEDSSLRGDENSSRPDHGSQETNREWVEKGFYQNQLSQCNTWSAAPAEVD